MKESKKISRQHRLNRTLVQVAHLYYDENLSQQEIADRLGVSRSLIAQYLLRAKNSGIVRIRIVAPDDSCEELAVSLKEYSGIRDIIVVTNPHGFYELALRAVAEAAARFIAGKLKDGDTFGLAWGKTTSMVVSLLKSSQARRMDIIPLLGESGNSDFHSQMNQLVIQAAKHLHARAHFLSLPMVVSSSRLRDALAEEAGIRDVIKRWDHVNLACVGIGVVPPVPGMVVYIGEEHLPQLVEAGAIGDMCGIYFDRQGRIIKSGLENRIVGMNIRQMKAVDCLVAVACGKEKAVSVLGAMRTGLLAALIIDRDMAECILEWMRSAGDQEERAGKK